MSEFKQSHEGPEFFEKEENSLDEGDKEILFPFRPKADGVLRHSTGFKIILCLLFGAVVFSLGHFTQPDTINESLGKIQTNWAKAREMGMHWFEVMKQQTNEFADRIPQQSSRNSATLLREGSGSTASMKKNGVPPQNSMASKKEKVEVRIDPTMTHNIGVKTARAQIKSLSREIKTVGFLTHDERLEHHIHTKYGGWIEKLYVDFTGQEIQKGDVLMEIYSPDLVSTQEELVLAMKYKEKMVPSSFPEFQESASRLIDSTIRRLELFDIPKHQIQELIKTRIVKKTMHIHTPMRGVVIKKNAQHGMHVEPGKMLYMIANLSNIWVQAEVYEYELPFIQLGQKAEMKLSYFPGKIFKGEITYINPLVNPENRTVEVRLEFTNEDRSLKPNMYADVKLITSPLKPEVVVPVEAVIQSGGQTRVVIQNDSNGFESHEVQLGVQAQGYFQVLKGLEAGAKIVVSSNFLIDSESRMKEALGKMEAN